MEGVATGVLVAAVAGVFALVGSRVASRQDHQRWLRQERLEAYHGLLMAANKLTIFQRRQHESQSQSPSDGPTELAELHDAVLERRQHESQSQSPSDGPTELTELDNAIQRVHLLGPPSLAKATLDVSRAALVAAWRKPSENPDESELFIALVALSDARAGFAIAATRVLGSDK